MDSKLPRNCFFLDAFNKVFTRIRRVGIKQSWPCLVSTRGECPRQKLCQDGSIDKSGSQAERSERVVDLLS